MTDAEIYKRVRREALAGNGSVANVYIDEMLGMLLMIYGDRFTVAGACQALDTMRDLTVVWKHELTKATHD